MKVLFVCLGNICRSPLAEALFLYHLNKKGLQSYFSADSCGTNGLHDGENADSRTRDNAKKHGIEINHISRKITKQEIADWDLIVVMDDSNYENVLKLNPNEEEIEKIVYLKDFDPEFEDDLDVPDPWFGGEEGFETVYNIIDRCILDLIDTIKPDLDELFPEGAPLTADD